MSEASQKLLSDYDAYHRHPYNRLTHYFGIPMIVFSILGFTHAVSLWHAWTLGRLVVLAVSFYYVRLDLYKGSLFSAVLFLMLRASPVVSLPQHLFLFVVGWVLQLLGHWRFEKNSPAFLENLRHLLLGPFWIFCKLLTPSK